MVAARAKCCVLALADVPVLPACSCHARRDGLTFTTTNTAQSDRDKTGSWELNLVIGYQESQGLG